MGRRRIDRKPCEEGALYHSRELVKYTPVALRVDKLKSSQFLTVFGENLYKSTVHVHQCLALAYATKDNYTKLSFLENALINLQAVESLIDAFVYTFPSVIKNLKHWAILIDNTRKSIKQWYRSTNKKLHEPMLDKDGFILLEHKCKG